MTCSRCLNKTPVHSSFTTYHRLVITLTRRVPLVEQKLPNLPEHLSSSPVFSRVRVAQLFVSSVLLSVDFLFSYGYCIVCTFSNLIIFLVYSNFFACHKHIYDEMSLKSSDKLIRIM